VNNELDTTWLPGEIEKDLERCKLGYPVSESIFEHRTLTDAKHKD
jgi:hypothetical protein